MLSKRITVYRLYLYDLTQKKSLTDPEVVKVSQELDKDIFKIQKIIYQFK